MAGRVAMVTGGGGGIGGAICRHLAAVGHRVAVADLAVAGAGVVADEIGGLAVELDVTDPGSCAAAVDEVGRALGEVGVRTGAPARDGHRAAHAARR